MKMNQDIADCLYLGVIVCAIAFMIATSGCALTTPDGYHVEVDAEQLDAILARIEAHQAARDAAQARDDAAAAERWQRQVDMALEALRNLQK